MTLDITELVNGHPQLFSASIAEIGENAAIVTWNNAKDHAAQSPLLPDHESCDYARDYFEEFGAWSVEELAGMSDTEINALTLQYVSGDIREFERFDTMREYRKASEDGRVSGSIYKQGRRFYFELSH